MELQDRLEHYTPIRLQGDGDYAQAKAFFEQYGGMDEGLQRDNERIDSAGLPLGFAVEQG